MVGVWYRSDLRKCLIINDLRGATHPPRNPLKMKDLQNPSS